jgi:hypothetical protein
MGSMMYAGIAGMSVFVRWVASTAPQMMEHLVPTFHAEPIPIGGSSKTPLEDFRAFTQHPPTLRASSREKIFSPASGTKHTFRSSS